MYYKYNREQDNWDKGNEIRFPNEVIIKNGKPASHEGFVWSKTEPIEYLEWIEIQKEQL